MVDSPSREGSPFPRFTSRPTGPSGTKLHIERTNCGSCDLGVSSAGCNCPRPIHRPSVRPDWDEYFLGIAIAVSARADCSRRKVGAVVVRDHRIVATGYNGAPPGGKSCLQGDCPRANSGVDPGSGYDTGPGACIAVHAEANAALYAGRDGCLGSTLYISCQPCDGCARLVEASGIARVVYPTL